MKSIFKIGAVLFLLLFAVFTVRAQHHYSEADVQDIIENAPSAADYPQASAVILLEQKILTVQEDGSSTLDEHLLIKILKHRGKQKYGDQKRKYDANTDSIRVLLAVTHKPSGKIVAVEKKAVNDITPPELADASVYANIQEKVISFPAVTPGAVLELKLRQFSKAPKDSADRHYWGMVGFQTDDPILTKEFVLVVPKDRDARYVFLHRKVEPEETELPSSYVYSWRIQKSPQIISEPYMPPFEDFIPLLVFSSEKQWDSVGRWLAGKFYKHAKPTPALRAKARQLTRGAKTREEKIRDIFLFVAQKIRTVHLRLGLAGYEPHDADSVLANRYGDTRDKSVLLVALLKAAGVDAYPALVNGNPVQLVQAIPTPRQFDQIYVAVPRSKKETLWLDPAADNTRYPYFIGGQGNQALVVQPGRGVLEKVKAFSPNFNRSDNRLDCTLDAAGTAVTSIVSRLNGYFDMRARNALKDETPKELEQYFQQMANGLGEGSTEISHSLSNLKNLLEPAVIRQKVKTPDLGIAEGNMMIFRVPRIPFEFVHNPFFPGLEKRHYDFLMESTMHVTVQGDVDIPAGYRVVYLPQNLQTKTPYGVWKIAFKAEGKRKIHYTYDYILNKKRVSVADYPDFKKTFDKFARPQNRLILLEKAAAMR